MQRFILACLLILGAIGIMAARGQAQIERWEYLKVYSERDDAKLNALGDAGWELVAVTNSSAGQIGWEFFKRRKP